MNQLEKEREREGERGRKACEGKENQKYMWWERKRENQEAMCIWRSKILENYWLLLRWPIFKLNVGVNIKKQNLYFN